MCKIISFFTLLFYLIMSPSFLLAWDLPGDCTFIGVEKYTQELKRNVCSILIENNLKNEDKNDDYIVAGSGFLIEKNKFVIGITCAHVISKYIKIENGKIICNKEMYIGLDTTDGFKRFGFNIVYIDTNNDFALLLPKKDSPQSAITLTNIVLNESYLGNNDLIIEGKGVLIIGYPLGLGIEYNKNFPVSKIGIIAQYTKQNYFLIDAVANPGNSGSPVYSLKDGKIIGMITAFRADSVPLFDENGKLVAALPYNSGLSNALPIEIIKKAIEGLR